jgi:predicted nucleic acid-binding protein
MYLLDTNICIYMINRRSQRAAAVFGMIRAELERKGRVIGAGAKPWFNLGDE